MMYRIVYHLVDTLSAEMISTFSAKQRLHLSVVFWYAVAFLCLNVSLKLSESFVKAVAQSVSAQSGRFCPGHVVPALRMWVSWKQDTFAMNCA